MGGVPYTGQTSDHRKEWLVGRIEELADLLACEFPAFSVMDNLSGSRLRSTGWLNSTPHGKSQSSRRAAEHGGNGAIEVGVPKRCKRRRILWQNLVRCS